MNTNTNWLDSLKVLALIGLIITEVGFRTGGMYELPTSIFIASTRFALPMVLMLAGATLLNKKYDLKTFYKRRFPIVAAPFIFWFFIYWIINYIEMRDVISPDIPSFLSWSRDLFLIEGVSRHFWLVYMLLALYLLVPLLAGFFRKLKPSMLVFLLAAWILISSIAKEFDVNMQVWYGNQLLKLTNYLVYGGYMILGFYLYNYLYVSKNIRISAWILYASTVAIALIMSYFTGIFDGTPKLNIYHYYGLNSIIQTSALFIAFKKTNTPTNKNFRWIQNTISAHSYSIYLIFFVVLTTIKSSSPYWGEMPAVISVPLLSILTIITSWAIVFLLHKIPLVEKIAGYNKL